MDNRIKAKVTDLKNRSENGVSSFSITYSGKKMENAEVSHEIISSLKAETDLFIEINSALLNMETHDKKNISAKFIDDLQRLGIEFTNKKVFDDAKRKILSVSFESKKVEGFEIYALIPNVIWFDSEFKKIIPRSGVRYYLTQEGSENNLTAFVDLTEEEKLELCTMVIFDHIMLSSMGIHSRNLTKNDIDELLK